MTTKRNAAEYGSANYLLDHIKEKLNLKTDIALVIAIKTSAPVISRIRAGSLKIGPKLLLSIHERTGIPVSEIRGLCGVK